MLRERQKVAGHHHTAWGNREDQPSLCVNVQSYLCRSLPALKETGAQSLGRNVTFYFIQVGKKGIWPMLYKNSAIPLIFPLCRCMNLDPPTGFQWSCHLPSNLFQTVTDTTSPRPPISLPPPHTFIPDESYFNAFLSQGTVLSGGGGNTGLYICIWSKTFEMCTKAAKSEKERDLCIEMS